MDRTGRWEAAWRAAALLLLGASLGFSATVLAADFPDIVPGLVEEPLGPPLPRYFPRSDADPTPVLPAPPRRRLAGCAPWRAPVPSDAPGDPSYVGSPYGLSKPSYYGFTPPLGYDDPFGRPLRYCP